MPHPPGATQDQKSPGQLGLKLIAKKQSTGVLHVSFYLFDNCLRYPDFHALVSPLVTYSDWHFAVCELFHRYDC